MNRLTIDKQITALNMLVEGNSIRGIERITGIHRDTIMRLSISVGENCRYYMNQNFHNLDCKNIECDEIWTFVGKKQKNVKSNDNPELGNQYIFVAIDRDTKLVPEYLVGNRDFHTAFLFMQNLRRRVKSGFQLTTDKFTGYYGAVTWTFGTMIDYATVTKLYHGDGNGRREGYSPCNLLRTEIGVVYGNPKPEKISTSFVERQNLTMRTYLKRLNRLTIAFSKKLVNLQAALSLHFWHYNFVRQHGTLRMTPAMAAGISNSFLNWDTVL